jgi:hypothetical protein
MKKALHGAFFRRGGMGHPAPKNDQNGDFPLVSLTCAWKPAPGLGLDFNLRFGMIFTVTTDFRPPPAQHRQPDQRKPWLHGLLAMSPQEAW